MAQNKVIDAHLHLDETRYKDAFLCAKELSKELSDSHIECGLVLNLFQNSWTRQTYVESVSKFENLRYLINVHPNENNCNDILDQYFVGPRCLGLKLHPRLDGYNVSSQQTINLVRHAGKIGALVLVDAFADGHGLMSGFDPVEYGRLAQACPETKIIFAHMGGHRVLDFMMIAKRYENFYMDLSYSLLYYRGSSVPGDMVYAIKSLKGKKVLYGSDYPDRSIAISLKDSLQILTKEGGLTDEELSQVMYDNAHDLFGKIKC